MADILHSQLLLRRDAVYMKTEKGIVFRTRKGVFSFSGTTMYRSFQRLLPYLSGACSGADLLDAIAHDNRDTVSQFLNALVQHDVVQLADPSSVHFLDEALREAFAAQLEFIRHYSDCAHERFLSFREKRILLVGSGAAVVASGTALLRNGLRTLHISCGAEADLEPLDRQCEYWHNQQIEASYSRVDRSAAVDGLNFDVVVYCSERPNLAEIQSLNAGATECGYYFLPAFIQADALTVGPLVDPLQPGCWQCAMLRWSDNVGGDAAATFWRHIAMGKQSAGTPGSSEVAAHILGNSAALETFKLCVGQPHPETRLKLLRQDLSTLEANVRTILPHPECSACLQVQQGEGRLIVNQSNTPSYSETPAAERLIRAWLPFIDEEFGVIKRFNDEDIDQIPLRVSVLDFCVSPKSDKQTTRELSAIGWSMASSDDARIDVLKKAVRFHAAHSAPSSVRRSPHPVPVESARKIKLSQIANWLGTSDAEETISKYLDCTDLASGEGASVPVAALHPDLDTGGWFDTNAAGIGVDASTEAALQEAVLSVFEHESIAGVALGRLRLQRWKPRAVEPRNTTEYLLSTARHLNLAAWEILITSPSAGVHSAVLVPLGEREIDVENLLIATRFSRSEAIDAVLSERIARAQMVHCTRDWNDVSFSRGIYAKACLGLQVDGEVEALETEAATDLREVAVALAARDAGIVWRDVTPFELEMTGTFRVVKALLVSTVSSSTP